MGNGNVMTNTSVTTRSRTRGVLSCELFVLSLGILHITFYSAKVSECKKYNFLPALRLFVKYPKMDAYRIAAAGGHTVFIIQTFTFTAFNVHILPQVLV